VYPFDVFDLLVVHTVTHITKQDTC